jgi:hypothetical protein
MEKRHLRIQNLDDRIVGCRDMDWMEAAHFDVANINLGAPYEQVRRYKKYLCTRKSVQSVTWSAS